MAKEQILNPNIRERRIIFILIISLCWWIISVAGVRIYEFQPYDFGPFQYMPFFFWPFFIIVCFINIIKTKKHTKILSMLILGLMTIGTLSIIEPYGRMHDSWQNVATSKIIYSTGTLNFGHDYVQSYPLHYLIFGTLLEITSMSVRDIVRFTPIFMVFAYLSGLILIIKSFSPLFRLNSKEILNITSISFLFLSIFGLSLLGLRINPAPQSIAFILFFYFIFTFLKNEIKWRILSLLLFFSIISTHFITPIVMIYSFFCFIVGYIILNKNDVENNNHYISRFALPFVAFSSWSVFISILFFRYSINFAEQLFYLENKYNLETVGGSIPGNEQILIIRQITMVIVGFLLIYCFYILMRNRRDIGIPLGLFGLALTPGLIFYILQSEFSSRVLEFSVLSISLIFGFGVYETLKSKKYFTCFAIVLILIASLTSVFTTNNGDIYESISANEIASSNFITKYADTNKFIYPFRLPSEDYSVLWNGSAPLISTIHTNVSEIILNLKDNTVIISDNWINKQMYIERKKNNSIRFIEANYATNVYAKKIYDNGKNRIYNTFIKSSST